MHRFSALLVLGVLLVVAPAATAGIQPAGTGEPLYTNSAQNTQWFEWSATSGIGAYRGQFSYYENNVLVSSQTVSLTNGGSSWANWSGVRTLQHGSQYGICTQGQYTFPNDSLWISDGPNSCSMGTMLGRRAYTTIDRSKPTAAITLAGGATYTRSPAVAVSTAFSDDVAGPFPANFVCFQFGGSTNICDAGAGYVYGYNANCSVPSSGGKSTTFLCTADVSAAPDGPVWACVRAADASIPDNPNGPNQSQSAEKANLSDPSCDQVVLDRTAPTAAINGPEAAKTGDLVSFDAQAADATSGLGAASWSFGDNTAGATGASATHTFTTPGTYQVKLTVSDVAGNETTATRTITVSAPATPGTTPENVTQGGGSGAAAGVGAVQQAAGPGGTQTAAATALDVVAPRRLALAKASRGLPLALTADGAGRATIALVRGGRVVARGTKAIAGAGTTSFRLKLPKRLSAGTHVLKITFVRAGGRASTATLKVALTGRRAKARARAAGRHGAEVSAAGAPVALPDNTFHGPRPSRRFAVAAN